VCDADRPRCSERLEKLEGKLKWMLERNAHEQIAPLPSPEAV